MVTSCKLVRRTRLGLGLAPIPENVGQVLETRALPKWVPSVTHADLERFQESLKKDQEEPLKRFLEDQEERMKDQEERFAKRLESFQEKLEQRFRRLLGTVGTVAGAALVYAAFKLKDRRH